jgi:hypothetical protein
LGAPGAPLADFLWGGLCVLPLLKAAPPFAGNGGALFSPGRRVSAR